MSNREKERDRLSRNIELLSNSIPVGLSMGVGGLASRNNKMLAAGLGTTVAGGLMTHAYCEKNKKKLKEIYGKNFSCSGSKDPVTKKHRIISALGGAGLSAAGFLASKDNKLLRNISLAGGGISAIRLGAALLGSDSKLNKNEKDMDKELKKIYKKQVDTDKAYRKKYKTLEALDIIGAIPTSAY